ncbi:MAG: hypothetical protein FWC42_09685 [Proteobacteria bacterium]|nr:hypothetical protein [Pseudomonadota bacterium]
MDAQDNGQNKIDDFSAPLTASAAPAFVADETRFIPGGRAVSAERGLSWIADAWNLFKKAPGIWIGFQLIYMASIFVLFILQIIPIVNIFTFPLTLLLPFVMLLLIAGIVHSCDLLRRNGTLAFGDLFAGFQRRVGPLLVVGLIGFGFMFVLGLISLFFFGGAALLLGMQAEPTTGTGVSVAMMVIGSVIMFVGYILYMMAIWFAPALVFMHNIAPIEAIKMSFSGCLKNILPGLIFFIAMGVLIFISIIPLGLGLLVMGPMYLICSYTSYRDIFIDDKRDSAACSLSE